LIRWFGFAFVLLSGILSGFCMCKDVKRREKILLDLIRAFQIMGAEIEYQLTPLQELCITVSNQSDTPSVKKLFSYVALSMEHFPGKTAGQIMHEALDINGLDTDLSSVLRDLFLHLGKQDVFSQVRALRCAEERMTYFHKNLLQTKQERVRSYKTLSLCTGLALAIILI